MVVQDACVVVQQLDKDVAPEPAQPLIILQHGKSAASSLVSRLKRPHLHACNASDQRRRKVPGGAATCLMRRPVVGNQRDKLTLIPRNQAPAPSPAHADAPPGQQRAAAPGS